MDLAKCCVFLVSAPHVVFLHPMLAALFALLSNVKCGLVPLAPKKRNALPTVYYF